MTKREICERLLAIWEMEPYKNTAEAIKHLLLDLAAPEEHFADAGKMVREEEAPPLFIYNDEDQKRPCPQCGQLCVRDMVSGKWWCRTHGSFRLKCREEGK